MGKSLSNVPPTLLERHFMQAFAGLVALIVLGIFGAWLFIDRDEDPRRVYPAIGIASVAAFVALITWPAAWLWSIVWWIISSPWSHPWLLVAVGLGVSVPIFMSFEDRENRRRLSAYLQTLETEEETP